MTRSDLAFLGRLALVGFILPPAWAVLAGATVELHHHQRLHKRMLQKRYLETLLHRCADEAFGQDAVEWAILSGALSLTYDLDTDLRAIFGAREGGEGSRYDEFCESWRRQCAQNADLLQASYAGLLEELNRPVPLHGCLGDAVPVAVQAPAVQPV